MNKLQEAWSSFSPEVAREYLRTYGSASIDSKAVLADVLKASTGDRELRLIELGCGNGQLAHYFFERGLQCRYTGVDFSVPLLGAARAAFSGRSDVQFILGDVESVELSDERFDFAIFSHVLEILHSPEQALKSAKRIANRVAIRFFEPPEFADTEIELKEMDVGNGPVPYLRWKMGRDFYQMILAKIGATRVDVYKSDSKDQVHILHFT